MQHLTTAELEAGLDAIRESPRDAGVIAMIVRRPEVDQREVLNTCQLDVDKGLIGDVWSTRPNRHTPDGGPDPNAQLTLMNSRAVDLMAQSKNRWPLAGDQLFVDFDLSVDNLPPGSQLDVGTAVVEITAQPHRGCKKFTDRYGLDAMKFVNSETGVQLNLRGVNARIVQSGIVNVGDAVIKR